jgi:glycosyltransferase involved in cell wall biosynthesis
LRASPHFLIDINSKNQAKKNLLEKKSSLKKYNIKLIAGSDLTKIQASNSFLFNTQSEILVFNGLIDFEIFNSLKRNIAKFVFDIPRETKVIFCGALNFKVKRKGYSELKDVLHALSNKKFEFKSELVVLIVGNVTERITIPNLNIKFINYINDPLLFSLAYQASDVFVSPSIEDCGPMMVVESLACGTPVVGFNIGLVSSLITNGENGYKILDYDTNEMSEKIADILSLKSDYFAANCVKSVIDKFALSSLNELVQKL